ncbi:TPA: hypothetical protein ACH3X3_014121 [Trebouxia sp. C0006]
MMALLWIRQQSKIVSSIIQKRLWCGKHASPCSGSHTCSLCLLIAISSTEDQEEERGQGSPACDALLSSELMQSVITWIVVVVAISSTKFWLVRYVCTACHSSRSSFTTAVIALDAAVQHCLFWLDIELPKVRGACVLLPVYILCVQFLLLGCLGCQEATTNKVNEGDTLRPGISQNDAPVDAITHHTCRAGSFPG